MTRVISSITSSVRMIKEDKILLLLSLIPIAIGIIIYVTLGAWLYTSFIPGGVEWIQGKISLDWLGSFFSWIVKGLFFILFGALANYTFVLVVSLFASPFNDLIVDRVLKKKQGIDPSLEVSLKESIKRLPKTIVNELKKISFILVLTVFSLVLSFIPFMAIVSLFIQVTLLSVTFLDYYWVKKDLSFRSCITDFKSDFIFNFSMGFIYFLVLFIPGGGVLFFPILLVSFFTKNKN